MKVKYYLVIFLVSLPAYGGDKPTVSEPIYLKGTVKLKENTASTMPSYRIKPQQLKKIKTLHLPPHVFTRNSLNNKNYISINKLTVNCSGGIAGINDAVEVTKQGRVKISSSTTNFPLESRPNRISGYKFSNWINIMKKHGFLDLPSKLAESEKHPDQMYCSLTAYYKHQSHSVPANKLNKKLVSIYEKIMLLQHVYYSDNYYN